jgi:hypothetical protein
MSAALCELLIAITTSIHTLAFVSQKATKGRGKITKPRQLGSPREFAAEEGAAWSTLISPRRLMKYRENETEDDLRKETLWFI